MTWRIEALAQRNSLFPTLEHNRERGNPGTLGNETGRDNANKEKKEEAGEVMEATKNSRRHLS